MYNLTHLCNSASTNAHCANAHQQIISKALLDACECGWRWIKSMAKRTTSELEEELDACVCSDGDNRARRKRTTINKTRNTAWHVWVLAVAKWTATIVKKCSFSVITSKCYECINGCDLARRKCTSIECGVQLVACVCFGGVEGTTTNEMRVAGNYAALVPDVTVRSL